MALIKYRVRRFNSRDFPGLVLDYRDLSRAEGGKESILRSTLELCVSNIDALIHTLDPHAPFRDRTIKCVNLRVKVGPASGTQPTNQQTANIIHAMLEAYDYPGYPSSFRFTAYITAYLTGYAWLEPIAGLRVTYPQWSTLGFDGVNKE